MLNSKQTLIIFFTLICTLGLHAQVGKNKYNELLSGTNTQEVNSNEQDKTKHHYVESANFSVEMQSEPQYPQGNAALYKYFFENTQYPQEAIDKKVEGTVTLSFYVETDSTISDIFVLAGLGSGLDEEAERLVKDLKFVPAIQNGKPVKAQMILPVIFSLNSINAKQ